MNPPPAGGLGPAGDRVVTGREGTGAAEAVQELVERNEYRRAGKPGIELPVEEGVGPTVNETDDRGAAPVQAKVRFGREDTLGGECFPHQALKLAHSNDLHFGPRSVRVMTQVNPCREDSARWLPAVVNCSAVTVR